MRFKKFKHEKVKSQTNNFVLIELIVETIEFRIVQNGLGLMLGLDVLAATKLLGRYESELCLQAPVDRH